MRRKLIVISRIISRFPQIEDSESRLALSLECLSQGQFYSA